MAQANALSDITTEVQRRIKGTTTNQMAAADWTAFIAEGLRIYSRHRPRKLVTKITGTGNSYYAINSTNFPSWIDGFSVILSVDVPSITISTGDTPNFQSRKEFLEYDDNSTHYFHMINFSPSSSESMVVEYTAIHTINGLESATTTTVADSDLIALINFSSACVCNALSSFYIQSSNAGMNAGVVDFRSRAREWLQLGQRYEIQAYRHLGINPDGQFGPASETVDTDAEYQQGGGDFITHSKTWR